MVNFLFLEIAFNKLAFRGIFLLLIFFNMYGAILNANCAPSIVSYGINFFLALL